MLLVNGRTKDNRRYRIWFGTSKKDLKALNDQIRELNWSTDDTEEQVTQLERQVDLLSTAIKATEDGTTCLTISAS